MTITVKGGRQEIQPGEWLIDLINRSGIEVPHVCYHPQLGPIQSCDTCMVEVDGKLVKACGTIAAEGMNVATSSPRADAAQREAFDRILGNHCSIARFATTTTATAQFITRPSCSRLSTRKSLISRSPTKRICPIPSTATIRTNVSSAGALFRLVKLSRSMKR
ncbi:MAG TPA: 2Fe-2S iron-sulfur cluster-binding protein [Terracidiphilus sp.]